MIRQTTFVGDTYDEVMDRAIEVANQLYTDGDWIVEIDNQEDYWMATVLRTNLGMLNQEVAMNNRYDNHMRWMYVSLLLIILYYMGGR